MIKNYKLSNRVEIPGVGFGTWQQSKEDAYRACLHALKVGYRHIDTAHAYENEDACGKAIKDSGLKREEVFITTKLPSHIKTYDETLKYFKESLENLGTDYIDLYLIHAPWPWSNIGLDCTEGNIEAWKAMITLYEGGYVKAIGVSNFHVKDIKAVTEATGFKPMVNQIRYFVGNRQDEITNYCLENDILIEAYSPLATGEMLKYDILDDLCKKYNKSKAQICLRYCLEKNTLPLPKTVTESRIEENFDIDFEMDKEDIKYLDTFHHVASTRQLRD